MAIEERPFGKPASSSTGGQPSEQGLQTARNTWQETLVELKKTTWPTKQEANRLTAVVIAVIIALGIYMAALDGILSYIDRAFKLT